MPSSHFPRRGHYVKNTTGSTITHGRPAAAGNIVGQAIKQRANPWDQGLVSPLTIANNEWYYLVAHGVIDVQAPSAGAYSGFAQGEAVYIDDTNMTLTESSSGNKLFGRVVEVADTTSTPLEARRGLSSGYVRIDLDIKSAVDAATA